MKQLLFLLLSASVIFGQIDSVKLKQDTLIINQKLDKIRDDQRKIINEFLAKDPTLNKMVGYETALNDRKKELVEEYKKQNKK